MAKRALSTERLGRWRPGVYGYSRRGRSVSSHGNARNVSFSSLRCGCMTCTVPRPWSEHCVVSAVTWHVERGVERSVVDGSRKHYAMLADISVSRSALWNVQI